MLSDVVDTLCQTIDNITQYKKEQKTNNTYTYLSRGPPPGPEPAPLWSLMHSLHSSVNRE